MQIQVEMTEKNYPGNIEDVDKDSNEDDSELRNKKLAIQSA